MATTATVSIAATRVATGLAQPDFVAAPPGDTSQLFILEKTGQIQILDLATDHVQPTPFLDLSAQVSTSDEQGLLGLAFDPNFAQTGRFFVDFVDRQGNTEIRSYHVSAINPNVADPASAQAVLTIPQPDFTNHKGGWIGFGPDGYLYIATGDGGSEGDPLGNAQNMHSLLGKMLRIDVNHDAFPQDPTKDYAIPPDNPFLGQNAAPEIWSLGLRNPWRDSFDPTTGKLIIADVGQNRWEQIDIGAAGANYGWNVREGLAPFAGGSLSGGIDTAPVLSYPHTASNGGAAAIVGGYVYEGPGDALHGQYFFADYVTGQVWTASNVGGQWVPTEWTSQIVPDAGHISHPDSFGTDAVGNLYIVDLGGDIWRLTPHVVNAAATTNIGADMVG
jgi:glucose/arabinose dehydrogenase